MFKLKFFCIMVISTIIMFYGVTSINAETYNYDNLGRLYQIIYDNGDRINYNYDEFGEIANITTIQWGEEPAVTVTFIVDEDVHVISGNLIQIIPYGEAATLPEVTAKLGFLTVGMRI